jgi:Domain of unknown function (DUF5916)
MLAVLLALQVPAAPDSIVAMGLRHRNGRVPRSITATATATPPKIDGRLDDPVWAQAEAQHGFRRDVPSDGKPATDDVEIRVLYDHDALYVGARLFDAHPELVSRRLNRRDSFSNFNDAFFVLIDSYHDHRTQFIFGVTPAGERRDAIATGDGTGEFDTGWDPVWEARTSLDSLGWVAELRIPFSQLRFSQKPVQAWGIQFRRDNVRAGEAVDWQWSPRSEPGQVSKYGHLLGLHDIPAPRRLEFLPYVSSQAQLTQGIPAANPFDDGSKGSMTGGIDVKYGLTSDLTLNATINPDFGQVEADPSVVNLTAYETFFSEQRPFFVEGSNLFLFGGGTNTYFYSRRIGRPPGISLLGAAPFVDEPASSSILGAVKLAGHTGSGWSIGVLDAVTGRETGRIADATGGGIQSVPVEPLSNYGVVRIKRDLGGGSSGFGIMATTVNREIDPQHFASIRRSAQFGGVDFFHRWRRNTWQVAGHLGASSIGGEPEAIQAAQLASARYYQRPDQSYVSYDPTATSLRGADGELTVAKEGGSWVYGVTSGFTTPGFEVNDAGFQTDADRIHFNAKGGRHWLSPGRLARSAAVDVSVTQDLNFGGVRLAPSGGVSGQIQTQGLATIYLSGVYRFQGLDDRTTRGGPLFRLPGQVIVAGVYQTDQRKMVAGGFHASYARDGAGSTGEAAAVSLTVQTPHGTRISLAPTYQHSRFDAFYLGAYADPTATATYGARYLFAALDQNVLSVTTRLDLYFTPNLSLQVYAQPFVATAAFGVPKAFTTPRGYAFSSYGANGSTIGVDQTGTTVLDADGSGPSPRFLYPNPDFRIRSIRSNVVLRWEYRPGSTLFLVWNQGRQTAIADPSFRPFHDLAGIFKDDMQNVFLVKANYYFSW